MLVSAALYLVVSTSNNAGSPSQSVELALAGRRSFDAMVCAGYAESSGQADEQRRLSELGLSEGRRFLEGVQSGQVTPADRSATVPILFSIIMAGPSVDFILGRFWEAASDYAGDRIWEKDAANRDGMHPPEEAARKLNAERFYREASCHSLR